MRTCEQTEAVLRSLNKELFDGQLQIELVVLPPEDGSFLTRLGVVVAAVYGAVFTFVESDIGKAYLKGLTGNEPAHYAESMGEAARESLADLGPKRASEPIDEADCGELILSEMTVSFLRKETRQLESIGITTRRFRDAYEAKNAFYEACDATPNLRAIGFSEAPMFPIQREDFGRLQIALPPDEEEALDHPWYVAEAVLKVSSPNWDRNDRSRRWKARDHQGRDRFFRVEDEEFWGRVSTDSLSTHIIDTMKVQWAFQGRGESPRNCRVLRVLEFNDTKLAEPLGEDALRAQLGQIADLDDDEQGDFFR